MPHVQQGIFERRISKPPQNREAATKNTMAQRQTDVGNMSIYQLSGKIPYRTTAQNAHSTTWPRENNR